MKWKPHPEGLALLERAGPFESKAYRDAVRATMDGITDLSWAGRGSDGTVAAVALLGSRALAECVPPEGYGSIASTRTMTNPEVATFLGAARRAVGARQLRFRAVAVTAEAEVYASFGKRGPSASVVPVDGDGAPEAGYSRLTRRSLKRAREAGVSVNVTDDGQAFLRIYERVATDWAMQYPRELILELGRSGVARFDEVLVDDRVQAGLMTLKGATHWTCWLAAQTPAAREVAASYVAYDHVFKEARGVVPLVSLGASAPGTGGAEFKRRLGAEERAACDWVTRTPVGFAEAVRSRLRAR